MTITSSSPRSAFYHDGYRARLNGEQCSPPDVPVYAAEYQKKLGAFQRASDRLNYSGGVLTIRTDTGTP